MFIAVVGVLAIAVRLKTIWNYDNGSKLLVANKLLN